MPNWSVVSFFEGQRTRKLPISAACGCRCSPGASEPHQLINTTGVCQEQGRKTAAAGGKTD